MNEQRRTEPAPTRRTQYVLQASWLEPNGTYAATAATALATTGEVQDRRSELNLAHGGKPDYRIEAWREELVHSDGSWRVDRKTSMNAAGDPVEPRTHQARAALHGDAT